jgi:hypothetical protein
MKDTKLQKYMVIKERVDLYKDFTFNLLFYIYKYYLDKKTLSTKEDIRNHFMFCYNKVCDEFKEEEIYFSDNEQLIEYFYKYYFYQFYKADDDIKQSEFVKYWLNVFEIDDQKNKSYLKLLIELYKCFDQSLIKEKNILEMV